MTDDNIDAFTTFVSINCRKSFVAHSELNKHILSNTIIFIQEPHCFNGRVSTVGEGLRVLCSGHSPRAAIAFPSNLSVAHLTQFSSRDLSVAIADFSGKNSILIISIYSESRDPVPLPELRSIFEYAEQNSLHVVLGGDTNAHSELWGYPASDPRAEAFESVLVPAGLVVENADLGSTWNNDRGSESTIDIIATSSTLQHFSKQIYMTKFTGSDHNMLSLDIDFKPKTRVVRPIGCTDWTKFKQLLSRRWIAPDVWNEVTLSRETDLLTKDIQNAFKAACPLKPRNGPRPVGRFNWWTTELSELKREYRKAKSKARRTQFEPDYAAMKETRTKYNRMIKKTKRDKEREEHEKLQRSDISILSKLITKKTLPSVPVFPAQDGAAGTPASTLSVLKDAHFPSATTVPGVREVRLRNFTNDHVRDSFKFVSCMNIKRAFNRFGPFKAPGLDEISPRLIYQFPDVLIKRVQLIYKAMLCLETTPDIWRESKVSFLAKQNRENHETPKDFRPITLQSFLLKGLERLVLWHLECKYLRTKPLSPHQHAFRYNHSCDSATSALSDFVEGALERKEKAIMVFLDIQGAFDNVDPDKAMDQARKRGFPPWFCNWYGDFLKNRSCVLSFGSETMTIFLSMGVLQGSILAPLIFTICVDPLLITLNIGRKRAFGFADDIAGGVRGKNIKWLTLCAQTLLRDCEAWAQDFGLSFSATKSQVMVFGCNERPELKLCGSVLPVVDNSTYLGMKFDKKLNFNMHVESKIAKGKKVLAQVRTYLGQHWGFRPSLTRDLINSTLISYLSYGSHLWSHKISKKNEQKLRKLHRLAVLCVAPVLNGTPTAGLEVIYNMPPLSLLLQQRSLCTYFRLRLQPTCVGGHLGFWRGKAGELDLSNMEFDNRKSVTTGPDFNIITQVDNHEGPKVNAITVYTDGSLQKHDSGSAVGFGVQVYEGLTESLSLSEPLPNYCTVFQAEMAALNVAARELLKSGVKDQNIQFYSDSLSSLLALDNMVMASGLTEDTQFLLNTLSRRNISLTLEWVKAHVGTEGNEKADALAKEGTTLLMPSRVTVNPGSGLYKARSRLQLRRKWEEAWKNSTPYRQSKQFFPQLSEQNSEDLLKLSRIKLGTVVKFLTGFNRLKAHASNCALILDDSCRHCEEEREEAFHLITECPALDVKRREIFLDKLPFGGDWSVKNLVKFIDIPSVSKSLEDPNNVL